jgi:DNA-binding MarR family transcriptional regulator
MIEPHNDPAAPKLLKLYEALEEFRGLEQLNTLLMMQTFLVIATRAPLTLTDLAKRVRLPGGTISGFIQRLGDGGGIEDKRVASPLHLISIVEDPEDARRRLAALTSKGAALADKLNALLSCTAEEPSREG